MRYGVASRAVTARYYCYVRKGIVSAIKEWLHYPPCDYPIRCASYINSFFVMHSYFVL